ncbi:hypothetical protein [Actinoallomurus sp. CA-150999]|uniref:hypothetical protein n=1 Tax=Actinoallomurus sp. CA-150999 TaxID=3239887 RepID=UPI003D8F9B84
MPSAAFTTVVAGSALVAGVALSAAIPALAAIGGAHTPGARAAATVNADGTVVRSTGVTSVRKISTGEYCIELDPDINAAKTVPVATPRSPSIWEAALFIDDRASKCGDTARNILVATGKTTGGFHDVPFNIVVD